MTNGNVLGFLAAPDRESSLRAISMAILKVRTGGTTYKDIAKAIGCSADTVEGAANEKSLLSFDAVMCLCFFWPEETETIRLLAVPPREAPTVDDRIERIERELAAIRREAA